MSIKRNRHEALRTLLDSETGSTQEEIKASLKDQGIMTSQATLSRDLREIGAVKVPVDGGKSIYRLNDLQRSGYGAGSFEQAVKEFVADCMEIGNFMVIKTKPGNARDFCLVLDRQHWQEIVGTIAGDDTILVIARTAEDINTVLARLS